MTTRKPLIVDAGNVKELPSGDSVDPATLATGTRDGTKFLRDDGTWQAVAGGGSTVTLGQIVALSAGLALP